MARVKDLTGRRFGRLTVIKFAGVKKHSQWEVLCDCGVRKIVSSNQLLHSNLKSCGCLKREDISGQRFGRLTAVKYLKSNRNGQAFWECRCDCGFLTVVNISCLKSGRTLSCGCLKLKKKQLKNPPVLPSVDFTGLKIRGFEVLRFHGFSKKQGALWEVSRSSGEIEIKSSFNLRQLVETEALSDNYVRKRLKKNTGLKSADIPQELVELKRIHLQIERILKNEKC